MLITSKRVSQVVTTVASKICSIKVIIGMYFKVYRHFKGFYLELGERNGDENIQYFIKL